VTEPDAQVTNLLPNELAAWLLPLLRFASPTLPIGSYAFSRGLEYAVHADWVHDEASASAWVLGLLEHVGAGLDGPLFVRLHAAASGTDPERLEHWNRRLLISRETAELRFEDTQLGAAFARLLAGQGVVAAQAWATRQDTCYATAFALAAAHFSVPVEPSLLAFLWAGAESQVSAAVRLIPLGQTASQRILGTLAQALPSCAARALACHDTQTGVLAPGLALASALHETQYTRLFRS
jgi:urease accessory protein